MQRAATETDKTIAVLSSNYLQAAYTQSEWGAAFVNDPRGIDRKLIPIRVAECEPTGILKPIVYVDLIGLTEEDARAALLGAFSERAKPESAPAFPGGPTPPTSHATAAQPAYPGEANVAFESVVPTLLARAENAGHDPLRESLSTDERFQLIQRLNAIPQQQFSMLVFAVRPPPGLIPPMPATQADRADALLAWAEGSNNCGVSTLRRLLETVDEALFRDFKKHLQWQWYYYDTSTSNSCYVALELFVYGRHQQAFTRLLRGQKDNPEAQGIYKRIKQTFASESSLWRAVATHTEIQDLSWGQVQLNLDWQYETHPGSLFRAWQAWQESLQSGNEEDAVRTIAELLSGQKHNAQVMDFYRAAFATNPERLMSMVDNMINPESIKARMSHRT
jgi:hypothetical protein